MSLIKVDYGELSGGGQISDIPYFEVRQTTKGTATQNITFTNDIDVLIIYNAERGITKWTQNTGTIQADNVTINSVNGNTANVSIASYNTIFDCYNIGIEIS